MAADELKPTQPLSPGLPTDLPPEDRRRPPSKPATDKQADDDSDEPQKRPPDNLIDEYV